MSSFRMQPVAILLLAVAAISSALAVVGASSALNTTCAALKTNDTQEYCRSVLGADPAAAAATDPRGVAVAAFNLTARNASSTLSVITYLIDELTTCRRLYSNMVDSLAGVLADFHAGRFDDAAVVKAEKADEAPGSCDILLFEGNSHKDPISQENDDNDLLANLATDILSLLASKRLGL